MFVYAEREQKRVAKDTIQKKEIKKTGLSSNLIHIPNHMKSNHENQSGFSFNDVCIHFNSDKPIQLQALAYTQGNTGGNTAVIQREKGLLTGTYVSIDNGMNCNIVGIIERFDEDSNNYIVNTDSGSILIDESFVNQISYEMYISEREKAGVKASPEDMAAISYSEAAQEFEEKLGIYLSVHPRAQNAVKELLNKIIAEIPLEENTEKYGTTKTTVAGMVGIELEALQQVVESGNLRERLTMVFNIFVTGSKISSVKNTLFGPEDQRQPVSFDRVARTSTIDRERGKDEYDRGKVKIGNIHEYGFDHIHIRPPVVSPPLSEREKSALGGEEGYKKWEQGGYVWDYNMETDFQKEGHALSVPIVAGPSGSSNAIMNIAKAHNVDLFDIRLALLGYLIPARQHSYHEIMLACADFGLPYNNTDLRYLYIAPLQIAELRENVVKYTRFKKFPHEIGKSLAASGVESYTYKKQPKL